MNAAQVRAKARIAVRRKEERIEQEEIEGGEINLIPYLDIVTNLMLFLLALTSTSMVLGQIDTTLPDHVKSSAQKPTDPKKDPDERIQPVVSVTDEGILLWSVSGLEGTLEDPKATIERLPSGEGEPPRYDYQKLNEALYEIASRRWKGELRAEKTYEIILQADGEIPYETIVKVMDAMRRKLPPDLKEGEKLPRISKPETEVQGEGDDAEEVPIEEYNPEEHYLFPDILFSLGFE